MTAPDVDGLREALADALGALPEAFNYTDYTDEQTTLLTMDVDGIADVAAAVFRPLLDAITAERAEARSAVESWMNAASHHAENNAALTEQIDRVKALRDEWNPKPEQSSTVLWDELNAALDGAS